MSAELSVESEDISIIISRNTIQFMAQYVQCITITCFDPFYANLQVVQGLKWAETCS